MDKKDIKAIEVLHKKLKPLFALVNMGIWDTMCISISHSLTNVRVNGHERFISYPDLLEDFHDHIVGYTRLVSTLPKIKPLLDKLQLIFDKYDKCPSCKGKQITKHEQGGHGPRYFFEDCGTCQGHGFIKKTKT